ncbi:MAG: hypothetical protein AAFQ99_12195 [Pseudomonadota bacterium]
MTNNREHEQNFSDQELTAFLDGQLDLSRASTLERRLGDDMALRGRLDVLTSGERAFSEAFAHLLEQAPRARLESSLRQAVTAARQTRQRAARGAAKSNRWFAMAASLLGAFVVGAGLGYVGAERPSQTVTATAAPGWRATVANYTRLYGDQTFPRGMEVNDAQRAKQLRQIEATFGLRTEVERLSEIGLQFRFSRILDFNGKPLGQLAFVDQNNTPMFYCIIASAKPDGEPKLEVVQDQQMVHWVDGQIGHLIIGRQDFENLEKIAQLL